MEEFGRESRSVCVYPFEDDDRIFYLSKDLGSGWNYKSEALISSCG